MIRMIYPGVTARHILDPYEINHHLNIPPTKRNYGNILHT
jgi:hypothetical protein